MILLNAADTGVLTNYDLMIHFLILQFTLFFRTVLFCVVLLSHKLLQFEHEDGDAINVSKSGSRPSTLLEGIQLVSRLKTALKQTFQSSE
jgi:hypothetical protein